MSYSCEDHSQAVLSADSIDSWSRTEPPGWMMALIPALAISSTLSANGKKASEANSAVKAVFSLVNGKANRSHSVGLTWPNAKCHVVVGHDDPV